MAEKPIEQGEAAAAIGLGGWRLLRGPWLAVLLGAFCYINSLPYELVYDDEVQVAENPRIRSLADARAIWLTDWLKPADAAAERLQQHRDLIYRPMMNFTLALNYELTGMNPAGFRSLNVILHMLACWLVWLLARRLLDDDALASAVAVLFAVHPVHVEAVVYIVGRAELMSATLLMGGVLIMTRRRDVPTGWLAALAAAPLFFLALLSKESAVCYGPVALLVLHAVYRRRVLQHLGWYAMQAGLLLIPLIAYLPLRYFVLGGHLSRSTPFAMLNPLAAATGFDRVLAPFTILGHYVRLMFWPVRLSADYGLAVLEPAAGATPMTWLGLAATLLLVVGLVGFVRGGTWRRVATLCSVWIVSTLLISNMFMLIATPLAERLAYWPSFAALALGVLGLRWLGELLRRRVRLSPGGLRGVGLVTVVLVTALLGGRTVARSLNWRDNLTLFTHDVANFPQSAQLHGNAAVDLVRLAHQATDRARSDPALRKAAEHYAEALRIYPGHWGFRSAYADVLAELGQLPQALDELVAVVEQRPGDAVLQAHLGNYLCQAGRFEAALPHLEAAHKLSPNNEEYISMLAQAYVNTGQSRRAIPLMRRVAELEPGLCQLRVVLSSLLLEENPLDALRYAREARELEPNNMQAWYMLGESQYAAGDLAAARSTFRELGDELPPKHPLGLRVRQRLAEMAE